MIAQIKPNLIRVRNGQNNMDYIYYEDEEDEREKVETETKSLHYVMTKYRDLLGVHLK